jgi:hypothetical protein
MNPVRYAAAICCALPLLASAQATSTARIDQRQLNQEARIQQGVQSGALTPRETGRLENGQSHIRNMENKAMADGVVNRKEAGRIEHAQDVQSRHIAHQKNDRQHDYNHNGRNDHRPRRG